MVSISKREFSPVISYSKRKKRDITSLLGQMCPPAAMSTSFGKLRPIVSSRAWWVVGVCKLPVAAVSRAYLVMIDSAAGLDWGRGLWLREGTRQRQRQWRRRGRLQGEGAFSSFGSLAGQSVLSSAMVTVSVGHVGVVDGAVVPIVGVPLGQDTVGVVAVDVGSQALTTPMAHPQAVETKPLHSCVCAYHVAWTTPSDNNCRRAVDGT
jgi:hypothetical protein